MKKKILFIFLLMFFLTQFSYSADDLLDASIRLLIPETDESQVSLYFNIGYGKYFEIIPDFMHSGIYVDGGLGWDWIYLISLFSGDKKENQKKEDYAFGFNLGYNFGIRLFSTINAGICQVTLFLGYSVSSLLLNTIDYGIIHGPKTGASVLIKIGEMGIGLEYAYYIPTIFSNRNTYHHISFLLRSGWLYY
jgi:hypothetical protein